MIPPAPLNYLVDEFLIDEFLAADKPITLHVTHSWGGGVAQWVHSFIEADETGLNFQLRSEGPQTGEGTGQRLSLYYGNKNRCSHSQLVVTTANPFHGRIK